MDIIELEKTCRKIVDLRTKRLALQEEINENVSKVLAHMDSLSKKKLKVSNFTLEVAKRTRRQFDWDFLDNLQAKGILPESAMKKTSYERLLITSSKNIRLVGGKFVKD